MATTELYTLSLHDALPISWVDELKILQDQASAESFAAIREVIESSMQQPLEKLFREFEQEPLAAASIGQVHKAVLHDGDRKSTRLNSSHVRISYAVFCLKK